MPDSTPDAVAEAPVSIVTGAGSGIGRATALRLGANGHRLVIVGRTESKLLETKAAIRAQSPTAEVMLETGDLADSGFAHAVVDRCVEAFDRVDNLVNAAGVAPLAAIDRTGEEVLEEAFLINAFGPAFLISRAWPHFRNQKAGCVVNISTIGTSDPFPGFFAYAASKAALDSFTRSIVAEGKRFNVRAFTINPGAVETPLLRLNFPEKTIPADKALAPEDVAARIVACIEGDHDDLVGQTQPLVRS